MNLNADPSLNELLVYYLKERTLVGRPEAAIQPDIQLMGLGIQVAAYTHFHKLTKLLRSCLIFVYVPGYGFTKLFYLKKYFYFI